MPVLLHPGRSQDAVGGLRLSEIGFPDIIIIVSEISRIINFRRLLSKMMVLEP
jgi:hypothetical protein